MIMNKLKEGEVLEFRVGRKISDPLGAGYFVLTDPGQKKYLLPADTYRHYGIKPGTSIKCRIDKINCKGEIFLEPENPHYSEGRHYEFTVIGDDFRTDRSGNEVSVVLVSDLFRNIIAVPYEKLPEKGSPIRLLVERISKGRLFLCPPPEKKKKDPLVKHRIYDFVVEGIGRGLDDEEYYILRDAFGESHSIPMKYYDHYGFKPGDTIKGKVIKYMHNGEKIIEPVNPYYKPGRFLTLKVVRCTRNIINESFTLDLVDKFGFSHCIPTEAPPEKEIVRCRVKMIRKGKPLLVLL
jgi:hypothetical protein